MTDFDSMKIAMGFKGKDKRIENDFYPTPENAIIPILKYLPNTKIWEPACGDGAISKVLINNGFDVVSTDKNDYGYGITGIDFLNEEVKRASIMITNPPFSLLNEFIFRAYLLGIDEFFLLAPLDKLNGIKRTYLLEQCGLFGIYGFRGRLKFNGGKQPMMFHAWYHFKKDHCDEIEFRFIHTTDSYQPKLNF